MTKQREVLEGELEVGITFRHTLQVTVPASWGVIASSTLAVFDQSEGGVDVTATTTTGNQTINNNVITTKAILGLTAGHTYRAVITMTMSDGNIDSCYVDIACQL